jgi:RNA polymerase sigma-70 factor, ECF subfamily
MVASMPSSPPSGSHCGPDVLALIAAAQSGGQADVGQLLTLYRNYLQILAATQIDRRLTARLSPSDIVQETMLRAHANFGRFRGSSEGELLAWLRQILVNNLATFVEQHLLAARRDVRREVSLQQLAQSLTQSTIHMAAMIPSRGESPSQIAQHREEAVLLADRLATLPEDYRQVLLLRNLKGLSFDEVAAELGRSASAARMLWLRAIDKLRAMYVTDNSSLQ